MIEAAETILNDPVALLSSTLRRMPNGKEMAANIYRRLFTLREFDPEFLAKAIKMDEPHNLTMASKIQHMQLDLAS
ncbi:MAG TPA: hypothetical protein VKJ65_06330 [Phycisphaerae bacterium]|nr:hypothetical protein [Phycisphaerae bacterium]